jgi:oligosaccharide repeat unit polymerase
MDYFFVIKILNFFLSSLFLVSAWGAKKIVGVWLNPASIFLIFWLVYTSIPLMIAYEAPVNPLVIIYILICGLAFTLPFSIFKWSFALKRNNAKKESSYYFQNNKIISIFYICSISSTILIMFATLKQGITIDEIIKNPILVAGKYAAMRYAEELESNILSKLGLQISYYSAILGGLIYGSNKKVNGKKLIVIISFLPSTIIMILHSAKGLFAFSIFLFIGSILVTRIYDKKLYLFNYSGFKTFVTYGFITLPFIILSFVTRGNSDFDDLTLIFNTLRASLVSYSSVHLPAFSDWFGNRYLEDSILNYNQESMQMGFYTLMSIFRIFGDDRIIPIGTYDEFYQYGDFISGNLYTVFRGLIMDFGLIGSILFMFAAGFVCASMFKNLLYKVYSPFCITFFIFFMGISYQTYLISSLMWLTIPIVFLSQWIILVLLGGFKYELQHGLTRRETPRGVS